MSGFCKFKKVVTLPPIKVVETLRDDGGASLSPRTLPLHGQWAPTLSPCGARDFASLRFAARIFPILEFSKIEYFSITHIFQCFASKG